MKIFSKFFEEAIAWLAVGIILLIAVKLILTFLG